MTENVFVLSSNLTNLSGNVLIVTLRGVSTQGSPINLSYFCSSLTVTSRHPEASKSRNLGREKPEAAHSLSQLKTLNWYFKGKHLYLNLIKNRVYSQARWRASLIPAPESKGRWISMNMDLRPVWLTKGGPGQPGRRRETLSRNIKIKRQTTARGGGRELGLALSFLSASVADSNYRSLHTWVEQRWG